MWNDIVITGSDKEGIQILINHLSSSFLTKDLGKLRYFLGIEVARSKAGISLSQRKYTLDILQDTGYLGSKPVATPMEPNLKLMPDEGDFVDDPDTYRRLVVIRILKYLKNAPGRGLFYRSSGHLRIEGGNLVTWRSKKQSVVARSSAEAEYRAMAHTTCRPFILLVIQSSMKEPSISKLIVTLFVLKWNQKTSSHHLYLLGSQLADIFTKALPKNAIGHAP
uniref:Reverse transcriptase Ty1/copia-type domain-containing protein n=1 Tax=Fagus sylvatica TaxID=28930 RepID=A0A2N9GJY0_FAGSY